MECRELTELAVASLSGGLDHSGQRELADHLEGCPTCREESQRIEGVWKQLGEDPDRTMSPEFRRRSLALIEDEMVRRRVREFAPRRRWVAFAAQAAAIIVAVTVGWFAHRPATSSGAAPAAGSAVPSDGTLSNVTYRQADPDGKVAVSFDVTSHRTVVGRPQDPALAGLLAYLVSQGTRTAGEKSQAIDLVSSHFGAGAQTASPEVVRALTTTLRRDPNPGVRKKAADALAGFPMAPEIRSAFFEALAKDTNPAVRLAAVDALAAAAKQAPDARTIQSLRERAVDPEENGFVRAKAASALKAVEF